MICGLVFGILSIGVLGGLAIYIYRKRKALKISTNFEENYE